MGVGEPLRARVVEVRQGAGLEHPRRRFVAGDQVLRIAGGGLGHPLRRLQPALAQPGQPPRRAGEGGGPRVACVLLGGNQRRQPVREREGLEGGGRGVARVVPLAELRAELRRSRLGEAAVQDAEGRVVLARNDDELMVGANARVEADEQPSQRGGEVKSRCSRVRPAPARVPSLRKRKGVRGDGEPPAAVAPAASPWLERRAAGESTSATTPRPGGCGRPDTRADPVSRKRQGACGCGGSPVGSAGGGHEPNGLGPRPGSASMR